MKLRYDRSTDSATIVFNDRSSRDSLELCDGIVIDLDDDDQVVAIELDHATVHFNEAMATVLAER